MAEYPKLPLSVVIIACNEAHTIAQAVDSAHFAQEVLVIDGGSTDQTLQIATEHHAKALSHPWINETEQRRFGLAQAQTPWVFFLDADEVITPDLIQELRSINWQQSPYNSFIVPFQSYYLGYPIKWGDWKKDHKLRIVKKAQASIGDRWVHCSIQATGPVSTLQNKALHFSQPTLHVVLEKMNRYSELGARSKREENSQAPGGLSIALLRGFWTFIRGYILRLGFLDGAYGFMLAVSNAETCYYKYLKLRYSQNVG